ncbi:bifunctional diguanylate cyclase/phosphodiesterase [Marinococcus luteus]|uniref:bifunctional diguanylate cyclase/phosphodiesterase n=1 Tax=Marinococcus luteus TaxID=1122204 RepID=UPI002ACCCE1D|nr:EAL domain-containing protein [Marinococcus luteus]MDZ5783680.1 EAL domain-containing protein [Marinococcus luteus]
MRIGSYGTAHALISIAVFLAVMAFIFYPMLMADADSFDQHNAREDVGQVQAAVEQDIASMHTLNEDWATWDDSFQFMTDQHEEYIHTNLQNDTFINNDVSIILFVNKELETVYEKEVDLQNQQEGGVHRSLVSGVQKELQKSGEERTFLTGTDSGAHYFSVQHILPSDGSGNFNGYLVMGKAINDGYIDTVSDLFSFPINLRPGDGPSGTAITAEDADTIEGTWTAENADGRSAFQLGVMKDRVYFSELSDTMNTMVFFMLALLLAYFALTYYQFKFLVERPITSLSEQLKHIRIHHLLSHRVSLKRRPARELKELEESMNNMLERSEYAHLEVTHMAYTDHLTSLHNRHYVQEAFPGFLENHKNNTFVLFFDLDGFKRVNDSWGHKAGDELIRQAAARLNSMFTGPDSITARLGGDEFVVVTAADSREHLASVLEEAVTFLNKQYYFDDKATFISASAGVSSFPDDGESFDILLKHADTAMYEAKKNTAGRIVYYEELSLNDDYQFSLAIRNDIMFAFEKEEFYLEFQPIMEPGCENMEGAEALLRWKHPLYGRISPATFIPLLEETGDIHQVGAWVIHSSLKEAQKWRKIGFPSIKLSFNVSKIQIQSLDYLMASLDSALAETGFPPHLLRAEITEDNIDYDPQMTIDFITQLQQRGVKVALDDFGVGSSSLHSLRDLPINLVKLDRSFVRHIPSTTFDTTLLTGIYRLIEELDLDVVTEGVENAAQLEFVQQYSTSYVQGYYFSRPVPSVELIAFMKEKNKKDPSFIH